MASVKEQFFYQNFHNFLYFFFFKNLTFYHKNLNQIIKNKLSELDCRGSDELLKNKFTRTHEEMR